jgi:GAF domain-containing protein
MRVPSPGSPSDFADIARAFAEVQQVLPTLEAVAGNVPEVVGCQWVSVAVMDAIKERPSQLAASTDRDLALTIASIAVEAGSSPGTDAFEGGTVVVCNDLRHEVLYATYAQRMVRRTPVRAVLAVPLRLREETVGVLTCYGSRAGSFDEPAVSAAQVLAIHAAIAIVGAREGERADNLEVALLRSRTIGAALGILMERYKIAADESFSVLKRVSSHLNRPLASVAAELLQTRVLPGVAGRKSQERLTDARPHRPGAP